jgi:hypothetical protein
VAAQLSLFIQHAVADSRMLAGYRGNRFRRSDTCARLKRQFDDLVAAGPSAKRRRYMHAHG